MAQCKVCTHEIPTGAQVCATCGASVPLQAPAGSAKGMDEWLLRGVVGFLVVIVATAAAFSAWSMFASLTGGR